MSPASTPAAADAPGTARRQRADARRNVVALLDAAREAFAEAGVDVPAKRITDRAGVGVGTLYRHYPRRSDLIIAVLQQEIDDCVAAAEELAAAHAPREAVIRWIERFTAFVATKQGLAAALHSDGPAYEGLPERLLDQLEPALSGLLARLEAPPAGADAREIMTAIALLSQPVPGARDDFGRRMIGALLDGVAPGGS